MTTYERYRRMALNKYNGKAGPNADEIACKAAYAKRFHKITEEEYTDIMHICMAIVMPYFEYDETTKEGIEYLYDGSELRFPMNKI